MFNAFLQGGVNHRSAEASEFGTLEYYDTAPESPHLVAPKARIAQALTSRVGDGTSHEPLFSNNTAGLGEDPGLYNSTVRTVSRESSLLRHPTPDLQSLHGAYVGNVVRLEQSAERMSLSSNIEDEVKKMRQEQKLSSSRRSSVAVATRQFSSNSNSIVGVNSIARVGGFSPAAYIASPAESLHSPSWPVQFPTEETATRGESGELSGPGQRGRLFESPISTRSIPEHTKLGNGTIADQGMPYSTKNYIHGYQATQPNDADVVEDISQNAEGLLVRHGTTASKITYRKGQDPFTDFDGVHQDALPENEADAEQQSLLHSPFVADRAQSTMTVPIGFENMVYYPAPVPMMLNLPQKISKNPTAGQRGLRRSQMLGASFSPNVRKSTIGLPGHLGDQNTTAVVPDGHDSDGRRDTVLPPQLRATMFFEYPSVQQDVVIEGGSAVATLDSILAASAHAPVSAFTDHPIVGHVGREVYGRSGVRKSTSGLLPAKQEKRTIRSSINLLTNRKSSTGLHAIPGDYMAAANNNHESPLIDESADAGQNDFGDNFGNSELRDNIPYEEEQENTYTGQPTTLLAELQLRKQEQHLRNRTAATAFPNGMHSTLLQLDAVTQVQQRSRKEKHITLAWEDPSTQDVVNGTDEDVPLGVLFPGGKVVSKDAGRFDENMPLGLIAQRAMEDNEPLSQRRARLLGEPTVPGNVNTNRQSIYTLDLPGLAGDQNDEESDHEDETLAQRLQRLRTANTAPKQRRISTDFASEVMSQLGGLSEQKKPDPVDASKTPEPNETLGQRRKRLQAERLSKSERLDGENGNAARVASQRRLGIADIPHAHPAGSGQPTFNNSSYNNSSQQIVPPAMVEPQIYNHSHGYMANPPPFGHQGMAPYFNPLVYAAMGPNGYVGNGQNGHASMGRNINTITPVPQDQNPTQRDMIDQWRQSVRY